MSIYRLKPAFQNLLRPLVKQLYQWGVTANQVTLFACFISVALGLGLFLWDVPRWAFMAIPIWMLLRMAFNAIDGMLAREYAMQTPLGAFLNELTDVISDAALYLPFVAVLPSHPIWLGAFILLAALTEMTGVLGTTVGASRRYDGPMGKSDRAFVFGLLGFIVASAYVLPAWASWLMPLLVLLTVWTIINRVRGTLKELNTPPIQKAKS